MLPARACHCPALRFGHMPASNAPEQGIQLLTSAHCYVQEHTFTPGAYLGLAVKIHSGRLMTTNRIIPWLYWFVFFRKDHARGLNKGLENKGREFDSFVSGTNDSGSR
jgi:hypothetical protein